MPQASVVGSPASAYLHAAPPPFACSWWIGGWGAAWVQVAGELDLATSPQFRETLGEAERAASLVVLDLRELSFIASSGVHVILDVAGDAQRKGGRLLIVRGPAQVDRMLELTEVCMQVLTFDLDPAEAAPALSPPPLTANDNLLMARVKSGSIDAFEELYARYRERAYRVAFSVCRDRGRSEDAMQEAFVSIWSGRARYLPQRGTFAAWLLTAVRLRAIDVSRRDRKHSDHRASEQAIDLHPAPENIADLAVARDEAHRIRGLLAELPEAQLEVITLAFYGQLSHTEIATALDLPAGTVKGRMRLGLQKLRTSIERDAA